MFDVTCRMCGKSFKAKQANYTLCSDECRVLRRKQCVNQRNKEPERKEARNAYNRRYWRARFKKTFYCKICGLSIDQPLGNRKTMHDECILSEAAEYYAKNGGLNYMHYNRLYGRGYCVEDVIEVLNNG